MPALDVDGHPHAGSCHCLGLEACSGHLCPGRYGDLGLGGLYAVTGSDRWYSAASPGSVEVGRGLGMVRGIHILTHMAPGRMRLEGAEEVQEGKECQKSVEKWAAGVPGVEGRDNSVEEPRNMVQLVADRPEGRLAVHKALGDHMTVKAEAGMKVVGIDHKPGQDQEVEGSVADKYRLKGS